MALKQIGSFIDFAPIGSREQCIGENGSNEDRSLQQDRHSSQFRIFAPCLM
jgi:hypothetical protein